MQLATLGTSHKATDILAVAAMALCLLCASPAAEARKKHGTDASQPRHGSAKSPKTLRSPSEETTSERDRRLTRECRGRPNAGACLGYARP